MAGLDSLPALCLWVLQGRGLQHFQGFVQVAHGSKRPPLRLPRYQNLLARWYPECCLAGSCEAALVLFGRQRVSSRYGRVGGLLTFRLLIC